MERKYSDVLYILYDAAKHTSDGFIISTEINRNDKKEICSWLEFNGYIENVSYHGKHNVSCQVTNKTFDYFNI